MSDDFEILHVIPCQCRFDHFLRIDAYQDEPLLYMSFISEMRSLRQRVSDAWRTLLGKKVCPDEFVLSPKDTKKLAAVLLEIAEKQENYKYEAIVANTVGFGDRAG